jgi:insulin-like growth factor 2 receptor
MFYTFIFPSNQEIMSNNCKILDPMYNQNFDFNPLKSDLGHSFHSIDPGDDLISFNVCGKLNRPCANQTNVNACIKKPDGQEIVVGFTESLFLTNGRFHFNFSGQQCNGTQNYTMNVILNCDYDSLEQPFYIFPYVSIERQRKWISFAYLLIFLQKNDMCTFFVIWTTELACFKLPKAIEQSQCSVKDTDGHIFDLMPLSHDNKKYLKKKDSHFV